jgi:hypothetical protein
MRPRLRQKLRRDMGLRPMRCAPNRGELHLEKRTHRARLDALHVPECPLDFCTFRMFKTADSLPD